MSRYALVHVLAAWLATFLLCALTVCAAANVHVDNPDETDRKAWVNGVENSLQNDIYMNEFINRLRALKEAEDMGIVQKRVLDFGLGRGFSGSQAAKHLMGLAAASFAGGPGRRRRSAPAPLPLRQ